MSLVKNIMPDSIEELKELASNIDTSKIKTNIPFNKSKGEKYYEVKALNEREGALYLYGIIGSSLWADVNLVHIQEDIEALGDIDTLNVYIKSEGGSVFEGLAIYDLLKSLEMKVVTSIEGLAASMASIIYLAGEERHITENAALMIHNPWTWVEGDEAVLRSAADLLKAIKEVMIKIYDTHSNYSTKEISDMMDKETWLFGEDSFSAGFSTELIQELEVAACIKDFNVDGYTNGKEFLNKFNQPSATTDNQPKKEEDMPDPVKEPVATKPKEGEVNADEIAAKAKKEAMAAEKERRDGIRKMYSRFPGNDDLMNACLDDPEVTKQNAQDKLLAALGKDNEPLGRNTGPTTVHDQRDKFKAGFVSAICARIGFEKDDTSNNFRGYTLVEAARHALQIAGVHTGHMNKMEMVGAAFTHTSSDFGSILENIARKSMLKGHEEAEETFQIWTTPGILTDFKPTSRVDLNQFPSLKKVEDGAEYKHATIGDRGEKIQLATYGNLFNITRQTIINDDLNAFSKIPRKFGRAALRTVGDLVYAVLTGSHVMADGVELFHADHNNLADPASAMTTETIEAGRVAMATQKDPDNNATALNIRAKYLLTSIGKGGTARKVIKSETEVKSGQSNSKVPNIVQDLFDVIDDARITGTQWFLASDPNVNDTIEVAYLDGVQTPYLEQQQGWTIDGTEFKVRMDAGVKALAHEGLYKNAGA